MRHINIYNTTEEYNAAKSELYTLEHFVAYNKETNEILTKDIVNITFNITPEDAAINYSIDNESYDQVASNGVPIQVAYKSTLYYRISKDGYETITKSQAVNSDITVTENMNSPYILVSTNSSGSVGLNKYTNQEGTRTESITIPASSTDYKVDGLMYGFKLDRDNHITKLDTTYLNTSNIMNMNSMFNYCELLTSLDVSNFDTSNVTGMSSMFNGCETLTSLNLSNFDTSKVTTMGGMFMRCIGLISLDLSNFNTSNVTNMYYMFSGCRSLTSLDLSNFDTSKVTNMYYMFSGCISLTHIKCKQAFKDWCWTNQDTINLPLVMRDGGGGTWEIVS